MRNAILTGEWLLTDNGVTCSEGYRGIVVNDRTSGAVWKATREVTEAVVRTQERLRAEANEASRAEIEELKWDGAVLLEGWWVGTEQEHYTRIEPDADGYYSMPGWDWYEVAESDVTTVIG